MGCCSSKSPTNTTPTIAKIVAPPSSSQQTSHTSLTPLLYPTMNPEQFINIAIQKGYMPEFSFTGYKGIALVDKVYDGDTFWIRIPFNNEIHRIKCRTLGYDCSELKQKDFTTDRDTFVKSYKKLLQSEDKIIQLNLSQQFYLITSNNIQLDIDKYHQYINYILEHLIDFVNTDATQTSAIFKYAWGYAAKFYIISLLRKSRGILWVELGENDKYGRTIATFWRYSTHSPDVYVTENSINTEMIQTNLGYPYDGGNKQNQELILSTDIRAFIMRIFLENMKKTAEQRTWELFTPESV